MVAKGYTLGSQAVSKVQEFDKNNLDLTTKTQNAYKQTKEGVQTFNEKHDISNKAQGFVKNFESKVNEMDEKYKVTETIKNKTQKVRDSEIVKTTKSKIKSGMFALNNGLKATIAATKMKLGN